ncbi:XrtA/PEP-CTERM system-associated ATPase [Rivibacter subsaxonicus]|uniref:Putative secretion ATPase (PEP-CTERM system associated) n=1 Tax=Rivibacter subsaxonicus TaxID=457575 RepID=A0A4V2FU59_9BURK|nr:XrtA/PEP-CTERM system-associated ATPase [Rivibacter subsaxonicus]RZU00776.1 putative secretion ATPase (PEP-CTERM system associated) [Rivibacter subsaxonicus]
MFEPHFGFSGPPFQLSPAPDCYYASRGHSRALAYLKFGVYQAEGFIVITGEVGAGKTTLVRTLLQGLDQAQIVAAQIVNTQLNSGELLQAIATAFGVPLQGSSKAQMIATLEAFLTALTVAGKRALLVIDEAQNLGAQEIEELRMLSNFQFGSQALLQSFLVGQPELRLMLQSSVMEQLRQRVIASTHLGPLSAAETRAYVEYRLRRVGWDQFPQFESAAFAQIHALTGGIPRRINLLCTRLLLAAYLESLTVIDDRQVHTVARELEAELGTAATVPT